MSFDVRADQFTKSSLGCGCGVVDDLHCLQEERNLPAIKRIQRLHKLEFCELFEEVDLVLVGESIHDGVELERVARTLRPMVVGVVASVEPDNHLADHCVVFVLERDGAVTVLSRI